MYRMTGIGTSIVLIAAGAILAWAVTADADGVERPTILVQCRPSDPAERARLKTDVRTRVQEAVGIACDVILVPARSLPKTTSGKLARGRAKTMFLAGEILPLETNSPAA